MELSLADKVGSGAWSADNMSAWAASAALRANDTSTLPRAAASTCPSVNGVADESCEVCPSASGAQTLLSSASVTALNRSCMLMV